MKQREGDWFRNFQINYTKRMSYIIYINPIVGVWGLDQINNHSFITE